ncbi:ImmA/IrrE family metallo-endopeptidase [Pseudoroseomonas wenyumeiae]|uniref:DNA 3'-5' helicase n=1 Tax=Teichococcus wenyumeiae TaxID=2478470 RepID=A0A3A9JVT3_9PROT|nr:ATP-dependent helicase [Pseudoroseomonas wenyumeiae]RKK04928.1 ImmA/IrrE family metallo-endopeptidase [Pseudoroseomonas wenyumeiae]RMI26159.1 ImmA/IrrE family metallo-endopeptidase [Pseudoroseomonas wenyumeiae]
MNSFDAARIAARALRQATAAEVARPAILDLAEAAARHLGFEVTWVDPSSPLLHGTVAYLDAQAATVICARSGDDGERALLLAHEIGHEAVHRLTAGHDALVAAGTAKSRVRLSDYGPSERRELEAEVFAREFALPREEARRLYLDNGLNAAAIVARTGLPRGAVERQLLDSLLLPDVAPTPSGGGVAPGLDSSQEAAVSHGSGPLLLSAGPGTGKTRTLVARVRRLVERGVDPASILVLTFSRRAAAEASERICADLPDDGARVWVGTFHQFGMDLIRRHADRLSLPSNPTLLDGAAAVEALEDLLATLGLVHHRNLWAPERLLKGILSAISRAKDELVSPDRYEKLAEAMLAAADDPVKVDAAERAAEVARVYQAYQGMLRNLDAVDYGDQVMLPALLLEGDPELAAELRGRHRHVLVDEYQDVNQASIRLLKALVGPGGQIWAVGDARQAIYRFRGASSASMSRFSEDFGPHFAHSLGVNYRSCAEVVGAFLGFARTMAAAEGAPEPDLEAHRGLAGHAPVLAVCPDDGAEAAAVVAAVTELAGRGVRHGQQAVLCRGNAQAEKISGALEAAGIPVLRLGNVLERDEVRDLLSILSLAADTTGAGLPRVGSLPRYGLCLQDVRIAAASLRSGERTVLEALGDLCALTGLSPAGAAGLARLREDLAGHTPFSSPWAMLTTLMMVRSRWLADLALAPGVEGRMRCLAVWNLMEAIRTQPPGGSGPPVARFLRRLRRLAMLGEAGSLSDVPEAARGLDAVHVMTVHGSKGLEFEAVHLAGLHNGGFPHPYSAPACPPPPGLVDVASTTPVADADAEEECLFFVALSRARTHLRLYRSEAASVRRRKPSSYLTRVASMLTHAVAAPVAPVPVPPEAHVVISWPAGGPSLGAHHVEMMRRCPRRFLHTVLLGIRAARQTGPFSQTHDCVQRLINRLADGDDVAPGDLVSLDAVFDGLWLDHGPHDHGYAVHYRALGAQLVTSLHDRLEGRGGLTPGTHAVIVGAVRVVVRAEDALAIDGGRTLRRIRTGSDRRDDTDLSEVLLHLAARLTSSGGPGRAEVASLTDGSVREVVFTERVLANRKKKLDELSLQLTAGHFPSAPHGETCPRCPHWFACGRFPAGDLAIGGHSDIM